MFTKVKGEKEMTKKEFKKKCHAEKTKTAKLTDIGANDQPHRMLDRLYNGRC